MKTYFIADTHFGHTNIIKYCNRPFSNVEEMNEELIKYWNSVVNEDDIVYHLGDFAFKNGDITNLVSKLNGKIYLIRGNHDDKSINYYNAHGLEVIPTRTLIEDKKIILSHRSIPDRDIPAGFINVHGHIHNKPLEDEGFSKELHKCVSVEVIDYKPIEV